MPLCIVSNNQDKLSKIYVFYKKKNLCNIILQIKYINYIKFSDLFV